MKTRCIRYEGNVQGIGFRSSVLALAREYDITGSIKNLVDGAVELIIHGQEQELEEFLLAIRHSHLAGHIAEEQEIAMHAEFLSPLRGFRIL
jgi:acylphosphatase